MSHHAESRGHVATKLCLRYTRVERYRLMMIFKEGEKENRRYSNRDVRKGRYLHQHMTIFEWGDKRTSSGRLPLYYGPS